MKHHPVPATPFLQLLWSNAFLSRRKECRSFPGLDACVILCPHFALPHFAVNSSVAVREARERVRHCRAVSAARRSLPRDLRGCEMSRGRGSGSPAPSCWGLGHSVCAALLPGESLCSCKTTCWLSVAEGRAAFEGLVDVNRETFIITVGSRY